MLGWFRALMPKAERLFDLFDFPFQATSRRCRFEVPRLLLELKANIANLRIMPRSFSPRSFVKGYPKRPTLSTSPNFSNRMSTSEPRINESPFAKTIFE